MIVTQEGVDIVHRTECKVHDHNKDLVSVLCLLIPMHFQLALY